MILLLSHSKRKKRYIHWTAFTFLIIIPIIAVELINFTTMKSTSILFIFLSLIGYSISADEETPAKTTVGTTSEPVVITEVDSSEVDNTQIAQCLTNSGVKLYGAYWCSHCNNQKKMFGDAEKYITYVECDAKGENGDPDACSEAGITAYPTWISATNEKLTGSRDPQTVAEWAGCLE